MSRRKALLYILAIVALAALLPIGVSFADYTPEDCEDGEWEVRPNQTLYFIAYTCGVKVDALIAYNNIENPNLINTGQILLIPPVGWTPGSAVPEAPAAPPEQEPTTPPPPLPPAGSAKGGVIVEFGSLLYHFDGRMATVDITVHNQSVTPMLAGGRYYPNEGKDNPGGAHWVTLLGAVHGTFPYPQVVNELLWHATVYTDDSNSFPAYAGCIYEENIFAQGDEPLSRADDIWFHWETTLTGGWFDCGNAYQVKPEDMLPGQSGSAPLTMYLVHPREWDLVQSSDRQVVRIDLELFDTTGRSLGTVATQTFP